MRPHCQWWDDDAPPAAAAAVGPARPAGSQNQQSEGEIAGKEDRPDKVLETHRRPSRRAAVSPVTGKKKGSCHIRRGGFTGLALLLRLVVVGGGGLNGVLVEDLQYDFSQLLTKNNLPHGPIIWASTCLVGKKYAKQ